MTDTPVPCAFQELVLEISRPLGVNTIHSSHGRYVVSLKGVLKTQQQAEKKDRGRHKIV
jgi:hypothetical protein